MPRLATINLDWLEAEIEAEKEKMYRHDLQQYFRVFERGKNMLKLVRSKCTPIEEETIGADGNISLANQSPNSPLNVVGRASEKHSGLLYDGNKDTPKTCINHWESAKYCSNINSCEMCKTKE